MGLNTIKISQFEQYNNLLNGDEYLMVSANGKSYKVKTSVILGTIIDSIDQIVNQGDEAESQIIVKLKVPTENIENSALQSDNQTFEFTVKNGSRGSIGPTGPKGPKGDPGDSGVIISNIEDFRDKITSDLNVDDSTLGLSAAAGKILADKMSDKEEKFLHSQDAFDILMEENNIKDNVKYFIYDEDDVTDEEIEEEIASLHEFEG